jgi:tetratricopeptide (TPR) repeat protein
MRRRSDPNASVAWLPPPKGSNGLAGAAFLVGEDVALTCAHSVRDHLGLGEATPAQAPGEEIVLQFVALGQEVRATVASCGWFPDADIAVLSLAEPVDVTSAAPANAPPPGGTGCYAYGCPGDTVNLYGEHGQIVYLKFRPQVDGRGLHQLQPEQSGEIGFFVKRGFSGAPVFDELGNVVLGMVVRADEHHRVALAIPAAVLADALRKVRRCARQTGRAEPIIAQREPGPLDQLAASTLSFVRHGLGERPPEASGIVPPVGALQGAFRQAAEEAREPDLTEAVQQALERVRVGDSVPLEALLREHADRLMELAGGGNTLEPTIATSADLRRLSAEAFRELGALASLRSVDDALAAYRRAAALDPDDTWTWIFISRLERAAGRLVPAAAAAEAALERAEAVLLQRDQMAALNTLGEVRVSQGVLAAASEAFWSGKGIAEKFAAADPGNAGWQRDLSVSWIKIGVVRVAQGDLAGALAAHTASHAIAEKLAAADPGNANWQRDLSVSWDRIGDVRRAQDDLVGALGAYGAAKAIRDRLAAADPGNAGWQRDLSASWHRIGDVRRAQGDLGSALDAYGAAKAIADKLAAADPGNAGWQRDLSVSWNKLGDMRRAQDDLAGALDAYAAAKAIRDKLAAADPGNAEWQRDLSVSWEKIGDVRVAQDDLAAALDAYMVRHAIAENLAAADPGNAEWQRDLIVSHWRIADVAEREGVAGRAREHFQAALMITRRLETVGRLAPVDGYFTDALEERLAALDR